MIRVLANDGIHPDGKALLENNGFEVDTDKIPQEELAEKLNAYDAVLIRSATKIRKELIDVSPNLKFIGRGGVGMDNIDVAYAREKGITVNNTPAASSQSVAELVFAHLFTGVRFLYDANRQMPSNGDSEFKALKKKYAKGIELKGKTLGIVGFGKIGQAVAKMAIGLGMDVVPHDMFDRKLALELEFYKMQDATINIHVETASMNTLLEKSDFITLHVPAPSGAKAILDKTHFAKMKEGVGIINAARGGVVNEDDLIEALNSGKVDFAGLDVFDNEPTPRKDLLQHPKVSLSPHIGASTVEAQTRVWIEMADLLIAHFKN